MNCRLFVGNLPLSLEEAELRETFSEYGEIIAVKIVRDRETSDSRGSGFVEFLCDKDASRAQQALNGCLLQERALFVSEARQRRQR